MAYIAHSIFHKENGMLGMFEMVSSVTPWQSLNTNATLRNCRKQQRPVGAR